MKRTFKTIFCVLTICAMVSFYGCGKKDGDGAKKDGKSGAAASTDDGKEGSGDKK